MTESASPIVALSDLATGEEGDFFALLADRQELLTKEGKPYWRVTFRDARRDVSFPIWGDAPLAEACRTQWVVGEFYKLRALYRETNYGPQLEIRRIRPVEPTDEADGFTPQMCQPASRFDAKEMFADLVSLVEEAVTEAPLKRLVLDLLETHREELLVWPAATRNHHAFAGGYLEHVRNVATHARMLADRYAGLYPDLTPPLDVGLVVAGAVLHDIGKLRELCVTPLGGEYTPAGSLVGHILQGRDMIREAAAAQDADGEPLGAEQLLRLEHIIISHQRLPEWGSPKPPMTPEALLVHYADDCDAKFQMMRQILADDAAGGPLTSRRNVLGHALFRGDPLADAADN
ncbi:3'-5' exoribonuclease YhaM family protein [Botrimarina hoheduenensis]|uniref:3'-5' exoribonuclease YhaM n=1 Tax=Botrimarina hoheduenensis TaxID=2528000 RepID=A0A5C5VXN0_9BACT|nr:HD domain-containing protein [Botrimarina hoheduenensis]TWT43200.1 3'-5' exoribonuclease YhaM [Botrimarina hoheduenensis]